MSSSFEMVFIQCNKLKHDMTWLYSGGGDGANRQPYHLLNGYVDFVKLSIWGCLASAIYPLHAMPPTMSQNH